MIRVLITGKDSYVGANVAEHLNSLNTYSIETLDMKQPNWIDFDFGDFDVVFHVAGIAHVSTKKSMASLYFQVNRDLTVAVAKKAKIDGVKKFIFMSSMIVYNSKETKIDKSTIPSPDNFYGLSKLQAEKEILNLSSDSFEVIILRPPMIYGRNSKGNFPKLVKFAKKTLFFPNINNKRSAIYIDNLCIFVHNSITTLHSGIYFPQNSEYFSTSRVLRVVSGKFNKKIIFLSLFNILVKVAIKISTKVKKVIGDFYYDQSISIYNFDYQVTNFEESIINSIGEM